MTMKRILIVSILLVVAGSVFARLGARVIPYEQQRKMADLIVIATPTEVRETKERAPLPDWPGTPLEAIGIETVFEVLTTLKGDSSA